MKKILLLLLLVFITICATLYIKSSIESKNDPYFFLQPHDTTISYPIKIWEKGEKISEYFWIVPKKTRYNLFLQEVSDNANYVVLRISKPENLTLPYYPSGIFRPGLNENNKPLVQTSKNETSMILKLYKVYNDNSEMLIIDKNITQIGQADGFGGGYKDEIYFTHRFVYLPNAIWDVVSDDNGYYGRYKIELEVLGDWPQLKIDGMEYNIQITKIYVK